MENQLRDTIHAETSAQAEPPSGAMHISVLARAWLSKRLPAEIQFDPKPFGDYLGYWQARSNYLIAGTRNSWSYELALALASSFAAAGGHLIWIGTTQARAALCERLMFKIAGLELAAPGSTVQLDAAAQFKLKYAHEQVGKMWIDYCNVEECGDADIEQEFLASVASFKQTLIVVDESIFDEATLDPFESLVRQTHALHMINELRGTNPMSSVLWHLPMLAAVDDGVTKQRPTLDDLASGSAASSQMS